MGSSQGSLTSSAAEDEHSQVTMEVIQNKNYLDNMGLMSPYKPHFSSHYMI